MPIVQKMVTCVNQPFDPADLEVCLGCMYICAHRVCVCVQVCVCMSVSVYECMCVYVTAQLLTVDPFVIHSTGL